VIAQCNAIGILGARELAGASPSGPLSDPALGPPAAQSLLCVFAVPLLANISDSELSSGKERQRWGRSRVCRWGGQPTRYVSEMAWANGPVLDV